MTTGLQHDDPGGTEMPAAARRSTAHFLIEALNEVGIDYLFCNLGTDHAPIIEEIARWEAAGRHTPQVILCPHENVAVHMAAGYALRTGHGQGILVHVDVGTANAAMGLHNLFRSRLPALLMAGVAPFTSFGELTGSRDTYVHFIQQPQDQGALVRPYVKWEYTLPSGIIVKEVLARANSLMQSEPKGPVHLMLPREILTAEWGEAAVQAYPVDRYGPVPAAGTDPALIEQLGERLLASEHPVLVTSYAGRDPSASDAIYELAQFAGIRVIDYLSTNNIAWDLPGFAGHGVEGIGRADFGLMVDVELPWLPSATRPSEATYWAQVDVDVLKAGSPLWPFPAGLRLQGRSSKILAQLLSYLRDRASRAFCARAVKRLEEIVAERTAGRERLATLARDAGRPGAINPHHLCAELARLLKPDDIVVNEAVTNQSVPTAQIPRPQAGTMISNPGGGLGASGGLALGFKLACPQRTIVQLVGDGSFYFNNPTALYATSKQYALPILTIVFDNSGWSAVKGAVRRVYPVGTAAARDAFQSRLAPDMDFASVARAAGAHGERLTDPAAIGETLSRCLQIVRDGNTALVHVSLASH